MVTTSAAPHSMLHSAGRPLRRRRVLIVAAIVLFLGQWLAVDHLHGDVADLSDAACVLCAHGGTHAAPIADVGGFAPPATRPTVESATTCNTASRALRIRSAHPCRAPPGSPSR